MRDGDLRALLAAGVPAARAVLEHALVAGIAADAARTLQERFG